MSTDRNSETLKGQPTLELRRSIVAAMEHAGMSAQEIIEILESAIGVLKSGDMRSPTPGIDLARWIWGRFVGIPITEPYDKEFGLLLLKIAAYTDEIKQRISFEREDK